MAGCVSRVSTWSNANPSSQQASVKGRQLHVDKFDRRCHIQITVRSKISCQIINLKERCAAQFLPCRSLAELYHLLMLVSLLPLAPYHNTRESEYPCQERFRRQKTALALLKFPVGLDYLYGFLNSDLTCKNPGQSIARPQIAHL